MMTVVDADVRREIDLLRTTLTAERQRQRLSRQDFADLLGASRMAVYYWESGECAPTLYSLVRCARVLNLRVVVTDDAGCPIRCSVIQELGESPDVWARRCVISVLRDVRVGVRFQERSDVTVAAGLSSTSIIRWELFKASPTSSSLVRWALALGCRLRLAPVE